MHHRRLVALLAVSPALAGAQGAKLLARPDAEFAEPFTSVTGIRELRDGRVVTIDVRDKVVQIVDFKRGNAIKVGREGSGPGEYALPMRLLPLPGDSSAVFDPLNSRLLVITPDGKAAGFIRMQDAPAGGAGRGVRAGFAPPRFTDARGRLYWQGQSIQLRDGAPPVEGDSAPILRLDRGTQKVDTAAWVRVPKGNVSASGGPGRLQMRIGISNPFVARDEWGVLPDGRVAVLRSPEYRVDLVGAGSKPTVGTPIGYQRLALTDKHKQQWRDARKNQLAIMMTIDNGQRRASAGPPPADAPEPSDWPDVLPPFLENSAFPAPNGTIWVARTREAGDETPNFDVLDANGRVVARYEMPKGTRLVGVGNGVVYAVRNDEDDLQYLQRYRVP